MSELNTDKDPAASKASLCVLLNGFVHQCVHALQREGARGRV